MDTLATAFFLSLAANRIIEAVVTPLRAKFPQLDLWWLVYVAWVVGGVLAFFAGINLFESFFTDPTVGKLLTAIVVGGGSNLIADVFKANKPA
jgi:Na+/melibiose symporter-like transporter